MDKNSLLIYEIFHSIQGESYLVGNPFVFVRLAFCNLDCFYCDEPVALTKGHEQSIDSIIETVLATKCPNVCITGGEPLKQANVTVLIDRLIERGMRVSIETNGTYPIADLNPKLIRIMDLKLPMPNKYQPTILGNLKHLTPKDELKVVIKNERDYDAAVKIITENDLWNKIHVSFSPLHSEITPKWLGEKIIAENRPIRLNLQLHKYIWPENHHGH